MILSSDGCTQTEPTDQADLNSGPGIVPSDSQMTQQ